MSPRLTAALALTLALAAHAGLVLTLVRPEVAQIEGAGAPVEAALGANFASFATPAVPADAAKPALQAVQPQPLSAQPPATATPAATPAAKPAVPSSAQAVPVAAATASKPTIAAAPPPPRIVAHEPEPKAKPQPVATPAPKPKPRANPPIKQPVKKTVRKPAKPAPAPTKKGSATGSNQSFAKPSGTASRPAKKKKAGNAAASNYPGRVNRHIARRGRPSVGVPGRAVIRFTLKSNGRLASASVARSSGSAKLDRAALKLVRRAAPFPRPPAGAQRTFTISIKGK